LFIGGNPLVLIRPWRLGERCCHGFVVPPTGAVLVH
jgi:hypothetical protein